jgi:hypothetical protein
MLGCGSRLGATVGHIIAVIGGVLHGPNDTKARNTTIASGSLETKNIGTVNGPGQE